VEIMVADKQGNEVRCVHAAAAALGESPFWDVKSQTLFWVDISKRRIHNHDPASGRDAAWQTPEEVGCVATHAEGGLIVALRKGFHRFSIDKGAFAPVFVAADEPQSNRFNDGRTDRQGRFWCGSMDDCEKAPSGGLYRLDKQGRCERLVGDIVCSNALCWSPDGTVMYFGDSVPGVVWRWDFDPATGAISNRRIFVEVPPATGVPDGATVDAEGYVWIAHWGGWRVVRYDPAGRTDRALKVPVSQPTCPAFGGPGLETLFITSAAAGVAKPAGEPLAGGLFAVEPGVRGIADVPYG
jgi:sugar lactone lactonase YvrE